MRHGIQGLTHGTRTLANKTQVRALRTVAATVDSRFSEDTIKIKYAMLKQRFEKPLSRLNQFDVDTYDSLVSCQAAILEAKKDYVSESSPSEAKNAINAATEAYNSAWSSWLRWRNIFTSIVVGDLSAAETKTKTDLASMNAALENMKTVIANRADAPSARYSQGL